MKRIVIFMIAAGGLMTAGRLAAQEGMSSQLIPGLRSCEVDARVMSRAEKDSVRMVMELWQEYVSSFTDARIRERDRRALWVDGAQDYLAEFDDGNLLYATFRETDVLDIRKLNRGTYELILQTRSKLSGDYAGWVESVFRVCAMAVAKPSARARGFQNPFRLCNWLDAVLPTLRQQEMRGITFYSEAALPKAALRSEANFVARFKQEYDLPEGMPVRYVAAPTADACRQLSGFLFNAYANPLQTGVPTPSGTRTFFGKAYPSGIVLSNYLDDRHDLILSLVRDAHPDAMPIVAEGMAHYHGGFMNWSYETLKASLRTYLLRYRDFDLAVEDNLYDRSVPVQDGVSVPLEPLVGALLVEEAFTRYGAWKVSELLECRDYADLFPLLGVPAKNIDRWLRGLP